jgi:hypothetical protein
MVQMLLEHGASPSRIGRSGTGIGDATTPFQMVRFRSASFAFETLRPICLLLLEL